MNYLLTYVFEQFIEREYEKWLKKSVYDDDDDVLPMYNFLAVTFNIFFLSKTEYYFHFCKYGINE